MMLGGCAKNIPITKSIINEVGGIDNAKNFQYYVSKTITLKLVAQDRSTTIQDGQLIRKSKTSREKIVITEKLPGLLRGDYNEELIVAFEEYDGNPRLWFGVTKWSEGKHELLYQFPKESIVKYGNERYKVSYEGKGQPYLLIKMKGSSKESSKSRKAKGLKLGKSK
jgi:hypothetical protein